MTQIKVVVELNIDEEGNIQTLHYPLDEENEKMLNALPAGGLPHLSQSLMIESFKREAYVSFVSVLSQGTAIEDIHPEEVKQVCRGRFDKALDKYLGAICGMVMLEHMPQTEEASDSEPEASSGEEVDTISFD